MATDLDWPVDLPTAVLINNSAENNFNVIRSTVSLGPAKTRRRSTADVEQFQCSLMLRNTADRARFKQFISSADECDGGSQIFNWKNPQTGTSSEVRFVSIGAINHIGGNAFQVDFVLEILP